MNEPDSKRINSRFDELFIIAHQHTEWQAERQREDTGIFGHFLLLTCSALCHSGDIHLAHQCIDIQSHQPRIVIELMLYHLLALATIAQGKLCTYQLLSIECESNVGWHVRGVRPLSSLNQTN